MHLKSILKTSYLFALLILSISACTKSNPKGMQYSPCKNAETEKTVYQQLSQLDADSSNSNIFVDCSITSTDIHPANMTLAISQPSNAAKF